MLTALQGLRDPKDPENPRTQYGDIPKRQQKKDDEQAHGHLRVTASDEGNYTKAKSRNTDQHKATPSQSLEV